MEKPTIKLSRAAAPEGTKFEEWYVETPDGKRVENVIWADSEMGICQCYISEKTKYEILNNIKEKDFAITVSPSPYHDISHLNSREFYVRNIRIYYKGKNKKYTQFRKPKTSLWAKFKLFLFKYRSQKISETIKIYNEPKENLILYLPKSIDPENEEN